MFTMNKTLTKVAIVATAAAGFAMTVTPAASASLRQCADNRLCTWSNETYGGIFKQYIANSPTLGGDDNRFDSLWNRNSRSWYVYRNTGFSGTPYCLRPGYVVDKLADWGGNLHDDISSVAYTNITTCGRGSVPIGNYHGS